MDTAIEINGAFSDNSYVSAPDLSGRLIQLAPSGRGPKTVSVPGRRQETSGLGTAGVNGTTEQIGETSSGNVEGMMEAMGFSLAVLAVIGLGTLGGWAVTLVFNSLMQAQSLMVQNSFVFQR